MFEELTANASMTRIEEEVRRFWQRHAVPQAALALHADGPAYVIAQQPLGTAGRGAEPATQTSLLAAGDLLARYRRMRGDRVHHQIGWAGHGLAVEVAVEQALGPALRDYDLARFCDACHQAAVEGIRKGELLAGQLGVWSEPGTPDSYVTLAPQSVEKVWAALKRLWDGGQLRHELAVTPFCPRCATPLSAAEGARRAVEVERLAAGVYLPWIDEPNSYLLAWAPQPWTLIGLAGVAAHPDGEYVLVEVSRGRGSAPARILLTEAARERLLGSEGRIIRRLRGKALRGGRYRPLFTFVPDQAGAGRVVLSESVPWEQGSGLLPLAPAFDPLSLEIANAHHLPLPELMDETGRLGDAVTPWRGLSPLDAEPLIVQDLHSRGLLFSKRPERRSQALCPYCSTPLLPLARRVWQAGKWIISRDRAWGVALPIWQCVDCGQTVCMPGLSELAKRSGLDPAQIEVHRPAIDRLALACDVCGGTMRRVAPVLDAGFEAAVLPGAFSSEPGLANVAIGAGDQEIGWLGDVRKAAALLHGRPAWEQALAIPETDSTVEQSLDSLVAAGELRWCAYAPEGGAAAAQQMLRQTWALAFPPGRSQDEPELLSPSERGEGWLRVRLLQQVARVTNALEACDPGNAAEELVNLVQDMRSWQAARQTELPPEALDTFSRLLAPFLPHLAEAIYQRAGLGERPAPADGAAFSVHLAAWP